MDELVTGALRLLLLPEFRLSSAVFAGPVETSAHAMADHLTSHRAEHRATVNIVVPEPPVAVSQLPAYVDEQVAQLEELPRYELVSREVLSPKTGAAILLRQRLENDGAVYEQFQLFYALADRTVILTATDLAGADFATREPALRKMLTSALA